MTERAYYNKEMVTVTNERSDWYGVVGSVEIREGHDTDLVWIGGSAITQEPKHIRRIKPGDRIVRP